MVGEPLAFVVDATFRVTVVLGATWLATLAMRRAAASTRHLVWAGAMLGAVVVPAAAIVGPQWRVQVPVTLAATLAPALVTASTPAVPPAIGRAGTPALPTSVASRDASDAETRPALSLSRLAIGIWAVGALAVLAYLAVGMGAAWWLRRSARPLNDRWSDDAHALAEALEIRQPVVFAEAAVATPMVSGLRRPWILVPRDAHAWPESRLHVALLHELAHVKRRDCLVQTLAQIVCGLYWFNPLVWVASRRLQSERERACDDFVLSAGTSGSDYAGHLLEIAQGAQLRLSPFAFTGVAMARRTQLEGRLMAILNPALRRSSGRRTRLLAAAALVTISVPVATLRVTGADPVASADAEIGQAAAPSPVAESPGRPVPHAQSRQAAARPRTRRTPAEPIVAEALTRMLVEEAQRGNHEEILRLLDAGADINGIVHGDGTALIAAAHRGQLDVVRLLLDRGADVNVGSQGDGTPLINAAQKGHLQIVLLLLERGADVGQPFEGDGSPLIAAAQRGHLPLVTLLLDRGADLEQVVDGDENALIGASASGHLPVVQALVARGANVNARVWVDETHGRNGRPGPGEWRTPLNMAMRHGHDAVVSFLRSAGAQD
jgi:beta-lactamase regulating signal transducer with metallopeptidase domain